MSCCTRKSVDGSPALSEEELNELLEVSTVKKIKLDDGTAAIPSLGFASSDGLGLYHYGDDTLGIAASGLPAASIAGNTLASLDPIFMLDMPWGVASDSLRDTDGSAIPFVVGQQAEAERDLVYGDTLPYAYTWTALAHYQSSVTAAQQTRFNTSTFLTMSAWIRFDGQTGTSYWVEHYGGAADRIALYAVSTGLSIRFRSLFNMSWRRQALAVDTWYHLIVVCDKTDTANRKVYLNNVDDTVNWIRDTDLVNVDLTFSPPLINHNIGSDNGSLLNADVISLGQYAIFDFEPTEAQRALMYTTSVGQFHLFNVLESDIQYTENLSALQWSSLGQTTPCTVDQAGLVTVNNATQSTTVATGALVVTGGVGIAKALNVAETLNSQGIVTANSLQGSTSSSTGALVVTGGAGIGENLHVGGTLNSTGIVNANNAASSTSTASGALVVTGGVGIGENLYVGGDLYLPTSGGTPAPLDFYEEYTYVTDLSGPFTTPQSGTFLIYRIGNIVNLRLTNDVSDTGNGTSNVISTVTAIPTRFRPSTTLAQFFFKGLNNGSSSSLGYANVSNVNGHITFYATIQQASYTGVGVHTITRGLFAAWFI